MNKGIARYSKAFGGDNHYVANKGFITVAHEMAHQFTRFNSGWGAKNWYESGAMSVANQISLQAGYSFERIEYDAIDRRFLPQNARILNSGTY